MLLVDANLVIAQSMNKNKNKSIGALLFNTTGVNKQQAEVAATMPTEKFNNGLLNVHLSD